MTDINLSDSSIKAKQQLKELKPFPGSILEPRSSDEKIDTIRILMRSLSPNSRQIMDENVNG